MPDPLKAVSLTFRENPKIAKHLTHQIVETPMLSMSDGVLPG
jgi:hypothetical protein